MRRPLLWMALALVSASPTVSAQTTATYRVTFESTWSALTHPAGFPATAHFSPLIGAAHDATVVFWAPGTQASDGIEAMAERGQTGRLAQEIADAGTAAVRLDGPDLPVSPGRVALDIVVTEAHPLVTLVTMLAPSPDWFVGVSGLDLRKGAGWTARRVVPLAVYDAGTDSGATYSAPDADTQPRQPVALLAEAPFMAGAPVGTLTVERTSTAAEPDTGAPGLALAAPTPNPARTRALIRLHVGAPQAVRVTLVDALGRSVAVLADRTLAGDVDLEIDATRLPAGLYSVVAVGPAGRSVRRLSVVGR